MFGIDGSGKSTALKMLENSGLENTVYTSCLTTAVFEEELYRAENKLHFSRCDFFSHEFKHVLHIGSVIYKMFNTILPILNNGQNVILDRYAICIKLYADLFLEPSYKCISRALECLPTPDLGIYFDADIDTVLDRIKERSERSGIMPHFSESEESLIMKKARYETMIPHEKYAILRINANQDIDKVYSSVFEIISEECVCYNASCQWRK
ncbi:dTMP kinase [Anaerosporobacter sp.]|uniref:dTMP kinase n=1 Tax=Anaerosporobacter sp. TaxID=1872529 RepID=UPI00286EEA12|nr:hypothetical protein [Anaerosporobacter sp.]